ncbi:unnamed protein product [Sphagnum jensenii]|uniref:Uncharacterized protein n=1 Tax=Sphagnum jensenii TaxID=128206 RepID=A0ABP0VGP4_9BRYO
MIKPNASEAMMHPFARGVIKAWICLGPHDFWQLLMEVVILHIHAHSEELRSKLVTFEGKLDIVVRRDNFVKGNPTNAWVNVFPEFTEKIQKSCTPEAWQYLMNTGFSTSTSVHSKAIRSLNFMGSFKHFYRYTLMTKCGIPQVKLLGTQEDWNKLVQDALQLKMFLTEEYQQKWLPSVVSILQKIADTFNEVDLHFWKCMVKFNSVGGSGGGTYYSGWFSIFFPQPDLKLCLPWPEFVKFQESSKDRHPGYYGLMDSAFARRVSDVPFIWKYYDTTFSMFFKSGFVGMSLSEDGFLQLQQGWMVGEKGENVLMSPSVTIDEHIHTLHLQCNMYPSGVYNCNVCRENGKGQAYHCAECKWDACLNCV